MPPSATNPYESPAATSDDSSRRSPIPAILLVAVGAFIGAVSFAQMVSCVGYYVGAAVNGFDRQPPVLYLVFGCLFGALTGCPAGGIAGFRIRQGRRPRFLIIGPVCLVNTLALLGTIDLTFEFSWQSLTIRTALVGMVCGSFAGAILSVLFYSRHAANG
ncbi:G protein-coupled receptor family protein [Lignipirellula cremea]|uniref:hypothetical protein n=1 Tax=Lignipirellula cremea TaxID=2528010 RepID=UPI00119E6EDA|nr:hypothetical protein [Lignipirellula cremea]